MLKLIKNAEIYAPDYSGKQSLLLAGEKIFKIGNINEENLLAFDADIQIIDAANHFVFPGFIDPHVHLIGGGGEGGFATRTPEIQLSDIIRSGITTVVGCLGTDGTTRHMTSLLAKARGLDEEGITSYIYSGNYQVPTNTITGSVKEDIILIDKIIGAGEIAISDSRASQVSIGELAKLVAEARIGGLLSKKAGVTHFHVGPGKERLAPLHQLLDNYEIPAVNLYATHINRSQELMDDAIELAKKGAFVDITAGEDTKKWIHYFKEKKGDMKQLTISSDGNGSLPKFNEQGQLIKLEVASPRTLFDQVIHTMKNTTLELSAILALVTSNTAKALQLPNKGFVKEGYDADLLVLDKKTLDLQHVFAKGRQMLKDGEVIVRGTFE